MAHTTSPPKKFDEATMIAEAKRALSLDTTSPKDRQAALLYLLQHKALPQTTLVREILTVAFGTWAENGEVFRGFMELLCDRMPEWLKVGAYVLDHQSLRRVVSINSVFVTLSERLATRDEMGKFRQAQPFAGEKPEPITVIWSGVGDSYRLISNPQIIPASFAEMVQQHERSETPLGIGITGLGLYYIANPKDG
jgi:hypothetical protein